VHHTSYRRVPHQPVFLRIHRLVLLSPEYARAVGPRFPALCCTATSRKLNSPASPPRNPWLPLFTLRPINNVVAILQFFCLPPIRINAGKSITCTYTDPKPQIF